MRAFALFLSCFSCLSVLSWSPDIFSRGNEGIGFVGDRRWRGIRRNGGRENCGWDICMGVECIFNWKGRNQKRKEGKRKEVVWILLKQRKLHHLWNVYYNFHSNFQFFKSFYELSQYYNYKVYSLKFTVFKLLQESHAWTKLFQEKFDTLGFFRIISNLSEEWMGH